MWPITCFKLQALAPVMSTVVAARWRVLGHVCLPHEPRADSAHPSLSSGGSCGSSARIQRPLTCAPHRYILRAQGPAHFWNHSVETVKVAFLGASVSVNLNSDIEPCYLQDGLESVYINFLES